MNKIIDILSLFSPFILVSLFVFMSIFYQDLKAVIMLSGIFFMLFVLNTIIGNINTNDSSQYIMYCTMFDTLETPGTSTAIISFIFMYMLMPMIYNNQYNPLMLIALLLLWILDIYNKLFQFSCFQKSFGIIATLIGASIGVAFFLTIYSLGENYYNFLYFNISKNNLVQCSKNTDTEYVCDFTETVEGPINFTEQHDGVSFEGDPYHTQEGVEQRQDEIQTQLTDLKKLVDEIETATAGSGTGLTHAHHD